MKRIVSVCLPHWPIERLAVLNARQPVQSKFTRIQEVDDEVPFALVEAGHRGVRLSAVNRAGAACGLKAGDALADARTRIPTLKTADAQAALDRDGIRRLAGWLGRYGILRNAYGIAGESTGGHRIRHYGVWIDISGVAHLFGGEDRLLADLEGRLARLGLKGYAGCADTFGAAHALAWYGSGRPLKARIAAPGETLTALADLPVAALRLDEARVHLLHRLGFKTVGALAKVARVSLERRFRSPDESQRVLQRLDQALGIKSEPRRPLIEPPVLCVREPFAEPLISSGPLENEVRALVARLCGQLHAASLGVRAVRLSLYRCDGSVGEVTIALSKAGRSPDHLTGLLFEKLPALDLGFGVDLLVLDAVSTGELVYHQPSLTQDREAVCAQATGWLVDRLVNRLGSGRVVALAPSDSHWPECGEVRVPGLTNGRLSGGWGVAAGFDKPGGRGRPALLLAPPEPVSVMAEIPEGAPVHFTWRRVRYTVVRSQGPERIEPEWWKQLWPAAGTRARDYYTLEDRTGARFWVYREGRYDDDAEDGVRPGWFMHGVFA